MRQFLIFQNQFLSQLSIQSLLKAFDLVTDVGFFIKDANSRFVAANHDFLGQLGLKEESEIIGRTALNIVPSGLSGKYRQDDLTVIRTRRPLLGIAELILPPFGTPEIRITNKMPIITPENDVIGILGVSFIQRGQFELLNDNLVYQVLQYIQKNLDKNTPVLHLAEYFGMSPRSFERAFRRYIDISPKQFAIYARLLYACHNLRSGKSVSEASQECGFYDQSAFTKLFKKHIGTTPMKYIRDFSKNEPMRALNLSVTGVSFNNMRIQAKGN